MTAGQAGVDGSALPANGSASAGVVMREPDRIGPNAVIRLAEALQARHGSEIMRVIFRGAALSHYLDQFPTSMLDEREVITLHRVGREHLGEQVFAHVARLAGQLTGDYILANRIPAPAQRLLKWMPRWLAGRVLAKAISAHAWTFVGSGEFSARSRPGGMFLTIKNSPLARETHADIPLCSYYTATFERIFSRLVSPKTQVSEISCLATGGKACCFDIAFR